MIWDSTANLCEILRRLVVQEQEKPFLCPSCVFVTSAPSLLPSCSYTNHAPPPASNNNKHSHPFLPPHPHPAQPQTSRLHNTAQTYQPTLQGSHSQHSSLTLLFPSLNTTSLTTTGTPFFASVLSSITSVLIMAGTKDCAERILCWRPAQHWAVVRVGEGLEVLIEEV